MNKEDEDRQMRETRSLLQKARQRNASLDTRRDALRRLISLTHTPSTELKVYAAQNFSHYFSDFPDLEEDVIDSVYDICEDPDAQVRIEGYKAIVALSTEAKKWTRRNTDVLVQLLQSDEPHELAEIKASLIAHLNLDAAAAIGVMCDHCSLDPDLGIEEREDRERLRKIVLRFFATDAKKHILSHLRGRNSEPEQVLREGLIKAIEKADAQDSETIVRDLLLPLESYTPPSPHGDELLRVLLEKVKLIFAELKLKPGPVSLLPLRSYLVLMERVVVERRAADPGPLLRFYGTALIGKMALQKLDQESQLIVIEKLATALEASEHERLQRPQNVSSDELITMRNIVVDASPHILDSLSKVSTDHVVPWKACALLLKACLQRHHDQRWEPPPNFIRSVQDLNHRAEQIPDKSQDITKDIQKLLNELHIEATKPKPEVIDSPGAQKRKFDSDDLSSAGPVSRKGSVSKKMHVDRPPSRQEFRPQQASTSAQGITIPASSPRGPKLINRLGGDVSIGERPPVAEAPTLLRRMSSSDARSTNGTMTSHQRLSRAASADTAGLAAPTAPMPTTMLSIKGAASKLHTKTPPPPSPTLIDRMQQFDAAFDTQANRRRKKRSRAGG